LAPRGEHPITAPLPVTFHRVSSLICGQVAKDGGGLCIHFVLRDRFENIDLASFMTDATVYLQSFMEEINIMVVNMA